MDREYKEWLPNVLLIAALAEEFTTEKSGKLEDMYKDKNGKAIEHQVYTEEQIHHIKDEAIKTIDPYGKVNLTIVFSSIGLSNAPIALLNALYQAQLKEQDINYVIQYGSVGLVKCTADCQLKVGDVVQVTQATETDLITGFTVGQFPGRNLNSLGKKIDNEIFHQVNWMVDLNIPKVICGSSNSFSTAPLDTHWLDIRDKDGSKINWTLDQEIAAILKALEEYSLANLDSPKIKICVIKYVTNMMTELDLLKKNLNTQQLRERDALDWQINLEKAANVENSVPETKKIITCQEAFSEYGKIVIKEIVEDWSDSKQVTK